MGFWIFMLIMVLLIPITMIIFGRLFKVKPPQKINPLFGYRTSMSMKNMDTWRFAHYTAGTFWFLAGIVILPITVVSMLMVIQQPVQLVGTVGGVLVVIQIIFLISDIFYTERQLKKNFDQNGNRK